MISELKTNYINNDIYKKNNNHKSSYKKILIKEYISLYFIYCVTQEKSQYHKEFRFSKYNSKEKMMLNLIGFITIQGIKLLFKFNADILITATAKTYH